MHFLELARLHKNTNEPVFYMALAPYDYALNFFGAKWQLTLLVAISGPKKVSICRARPFKLPAYRNVFAPHQNHNGLRHIINRFINS